MYLSSQLFFKTPNKFQEKSKNWEVHDWEIRADLENVKHHLSGVVNTLENYNEMFSIFEL